MQLMEPKIRPWTVEEYHQAGKMGWFDGQRVQLVDGEVVVMSPQGFPHSYVVDVIAEKLKAAVGERFWVRSQLPLVLSDVSEPEPDISVIPGRRQDYAHHPTTAVLVIEVSDSTLYFDRKKKIRDYARAGLEHYWIVNLADRTIEVYEQPNRSADEATYARHRIVTANETIEFPEAPNARFNVIDLLPP